MYPPVSIRELRAVRKIYTKIEYIALALYTRVTTAIDRATPWIFGRNSKPTSETNIITPNIVKRTMSASFEFLILR